MDDYERVTIMKRLYYYKKRAIEEHNHDSVQAIERELDGLRKQKQDDPQYIKKVKAERIRNQKRQYKKHLASGYYLHYSRLYRKKYPDRIRKANRKWYSSLKSNPTRYKKYLRTKRIENRKLRKRAKVVKHV